MKLRAVTANGEHHGYRFDCPGCGEPHVIPTVGPKAWGFNGSLEAPTFSPSILVQWRHHDGQESREHRCHSYVRDGKIEFLSDCGHALAGRTVELPEVSP